MISKKQVKKIIKKTGWNIIPMPVFYRDDEGQKHHRFISSWQKFRSSTFPLKEWEAHKPQGIAILTGEISNLTVLDIDSKDALTEILRAMECKIEELSNYIVRTKHGWQLFYTYEANTTTKIGIKHKVDFLSGGLTFAHPLNEGYTIVVDNLPLSPMPKKLKKLLMVEEADDGSITLPSPIAKALEISLSNRAYKDPMAPLLKEFLDLDVIKKNSTVVKRMTKIFCSKQWNDRTLKQMGEPGIRHAAALYVGGIVASNITVSEKLYKRFFAHWHKKILKVDLNDPHEDNLFHGRVKANMDYWNYDKEWEGKSEEATDITHQLTSADYLGAYLLPQGKYMGYNKRSDTIQEYPNREDFKIAVVRMLKNLDPEGNEDLVPAGVALENFAEYICKFMPMDDRRFLRDEELYIDILNTFSPTKAMKVFSSAKKDSEAKIPDIYNKVYKNVMPVKKERDLFLHNMAYHLTFRSVPQTMTVLVGAGASGKGTTLEKIPSMIYGQYFIKTSVDKVKGRFRSHLRNKLFVFIDEGKEKINNYDSTTLANELKQLVANDMSTFEGKNQNIDANEPHHAMYTLASNNDTPFKLDDNGATDRRTNIFKTGDTPILDVVGMSYTNFEHELNNELDNFLKYLRTIPLDEKKVSEIIDNDQRKRMIEDSRDPVTRFVNALLSKEIDDLISLDYDTYTELTTLFKAPDAMYIEARDMGTMFGKYSGSVKKVLSRHPLVKVWRPTKFGLGGKITCYDFSMAWSK